MTEKRFEIADYPTDIIDTVTGKEYRMSSYYPHMEIICDLLNELHEENQQLKKENNDYDDAINEISDILREAYEQGVSNPYLKKISKVKVENR